MKALSMWQPWASLLAMGIKTIETRSRDTKFRGDFLIHATQKVSLHVYQRYYLADEELRLYVHDMLRIERMSVLSLRDLRELLPTGCIVGSCTLVDTKPAEEFCEDWKEKRRLWHLEKEIVLGDLSKGRWAWICKNHQHYQAPFIPAKGQQGAFWDTDVKL